MYIFLCLLIRVIIFNCLLTNVHSNNRILNNLKAIVNQALERDTSDELLVEQLNHLLEKEEGFRVIERSERSIDDNDDDRIDSFDGSGDRPPLEIVYANPSIVTITLGPTTTTTFTQYGAHAYSPCQCEKGDRGEKGDAGICPTDCALRYDTYAKNCLDTRMNVERLAQSIRQLIIDTKKIASRNAQKSPCTCQPTLDYSTYQRLKGEKGDPGTSCSCPQITQTNIRVFKTIDEALAGLYTYPEHTYIHIVNDFGHLQNVLIRIQNQLIPIKIENQYSLTVQQQTYLPTTLSIPKTSCSITLTCPRLHIFALGPHVRKMCAAKRSNSNCTKLSEYDELCSRVSEQKALKGFYRAFMSSSTQWLSNLFAGICVQAKIVNMHEQTLFDAVEDIFDQKPLQNEILDIDGLRPRFQYWWHGSYVNGTASADTCLDWSRHDSNLSGIASRLPDGVNGLFHHRYTWPCSIGESNMGILCIETNCNRERYYKH